MFAELPGGRTFYETQGEGPCVVCVHGLGGTSNLWFSLRGALATTFKVVTYDLSGAGRSAPARSYAIDGWVDQLTALLDHLQVEAAAVIGHSMGTVIAQRFAARQAQRTKALILAGALAELGPPGKEAFAKRAQAVEEGGMIAVADTVLGGALAPATREGNRALTGMVREMLLANAPAEYAGHCRALQVASVVADQGKITCPTLLIVGELDTVTPARLSRGFQKSIKNSQLRLVPQTAHLTMLERPEAFQTAVAEFLTGVLL